jgi:hypothetical protein
VEIFNSQLNFNKTFFGISMSEMEDQYMPWIHEHDERPYSMFLNGGLFM